MKRLGRNYVGVFVALFVASTMVSPATPTAATESICDLPQDERPDPLPEPVELCAVTELSGTQAGGVRVVLHNEATFTVPYIFGIGRQFGPGLGIDLQGSGLFVGFVLVSEGFTETTGTRVLAGQLSSEFSNWRLLWVHTDGVRQKPFGPTYTLPAGEYRFYLLPDSSPLTVTLTLDGPAGSVALIPYRSTGFDLRSLTPRVSLGPGQIYSAGDTGQLENSGILFHAFYVYLSPTRSRTVGLCLYPGDPEVPEAGFLPGCPPVGFLQLGPGTSIPPELDTTSGEGLAGFDEGTPGRWSQGWWHVTAGAVQSVHAMAFWLDLS